MMSESTAPSTMAEQGGTDHDGTTAMISNNGTEGDNKRKKMSMNFAVDEEGQPVGLPLDLFLFSTKKDSQEGLVRFTKTHRMPDTKLAPTYEYSKLPGQVPLSDDFHLELNRERVGPDDDGLDDEDLTHADGVIRKKKVFVGRRKSIIYDNIWVNKGEFLFPYRTYRPKVQVPYKGGAGQVPQAVVCERLHRLYKRTDINVVLQSLGIESSDLIPPPNYAETNERFYQEMTFRNRVRVNGVFKRDFIVQGKKNFQDFQDEHQVHTHLHAPKDGRSSLSYPSSEDSNPSTSNSNPSGENTIPTMDKHRHEKAGKDHHLDDIHPFIRSKPPFGHMFPINCFDNCTFDIRPPEEWIQLGLDFKDKRFYPLPGKAFLPLPAGAAKKKSPALSETVVDHLLTATPRLNRMYQWLLKERFERTVRMLGLDPSQVKNNPSEFDLSLLARLGSTVPSLFRTSDTRIIERITMQVRLSRQMHIARKTEGSMLSLMDAEQLVNSSGDSASDQNKGGPTDIQNYNDTMQFIDSAGTLIPVKNVIQKKRADRMKGSEEMEDEEKDDNYDDVTDQSNVVVLHDETEAPETIPEFELDGEQRNEETDAEEEEIDDEEGDEDEEEEDSKEWSGLPSEAILKGDYGQVRPTSPDFDSFIDGHTKFVIEFDKMKKVHIHDWKWVDVAVFDYNEKTERFYVRSIYAPIVHAWVPKIYLCFDGEDPNQHGKRVRDAVVRRIEWENIMRFNLYVDCLPVDGLPSISEKVMDIILAKTLSTPRLEYTDKSLEKVKKEIELEYKRTFAKAKFIQIIDKHHHLYKPWVSIPEQDRHYYYMLPQDSTTEWKRLQEISIDVPIQVFAYKKLRVQKLSVRFGEKEPREALNKIREICLDARRKFLILTDLELMEIDEWERRQIENIKEVRKFLTEEWCQLVVNVLVENLGKIPHSWYNLKETNYEIFIMSKLNNYLTLIKLMMEDTIRSMVTEALEKFINRLKEVTSEINYKRRFAWDKRDLINSLYPPPKGVPPLWTIDIVMEADSARYNHKLGDFSTVVKNLFTRVVEAVKDLPTLLPKVMPQMQFATRPFLLCPEEGEPEMQRLSKEMQKYLKRTLLPIDTYVLLYNKYLTIWNTEEFLKEWNVKRHTAEEVASEVELHRSQEAVYEKDIPKFISITGFVVNVEILRTELLHKKKNMYTTILDAHSQKLRKIIQRVNEEYEEMERKLNIRSNIIEEVKELKFYVAAVPAQVEKLQEITIGVINDYTVFDRFLYNIPDEDVFAKWNTLVYAGTIMRLSKAAVNWLIDDYDRSLDLQQEQLNALSSEVEALSYGVIALSEFVDLEQATEVCEQIDKLLEQEKGFQEQCNLLNRRQKIFGCPSLLQDELDNILTGIQPYHDLWFTCVDWLKVIDAVNNATLEEVDIDALVFVINQGVDKISQCAIHFGEAGLSKVQAIAVKVKEKMDEFLPLAPLMRALRNDGLRSRHWEAISDITGIPVVAKTENFKYLLEQGIATYCQRIVDIGDLATKELEIEVALENMQEKIAEYEVTFSLDSVSKQHYISMSDESKEIVEEYVKKTEELKENPFNPPFEEELAKWERKINMAKNSMELWFKLQQDWLVEIEPNFRAADIKTRLPVEYKLFEKMQRIWKRLIRHVKSKPMLIEVASDSTVAASLQQFDELAGTIKKALEERQRPKGSDEDSD